MKGNTWMKGMGVRSRRKREGAKEECIERRKWGEGGGARETREKWLEPRSGLCQDRDSVFTGVHPSCRSHIHSVSEEALEMTKSELWRCSLCLSSFCASLRAFTLLTLVDREHAPLPPAFPSAPGSHLRFSSTFVE